jgi:hypothetical protein
MWWKKRKCLKKEKENKIEWNDEKVVTIEEKKERKDEKQLR